jgi:hypothetical protein
MLPSNLAQDLKTKYQGALGETMLIELADGMLVTMDDSPIPVL